MYAWCRLLRELPVLDGVCQRSCRRFALARRRFPVSIKDITSVCTSDLLEESSLVMPWLTDDAVNYRVAQLAAQDNTCTSLGTYDFILWHREWTKDGTVRDQIVKQIPQCGKIYLPRIVGHSSPETGNHFILWVFDFSCKEIRIYDSLSLYKNISDDDMALLRNVFRSSGGLQGWTVIFPPQWKQQDSINCVCSAVENEVQRHKVSAEPLTVSQYRTLRLHHASEMLKNVDPKDFPPTIASKEAIVMEKKESKLQETEQRDTDSSMHCLAWKIRTCLFQRATGKTLLFHGHIKKYRWVQCTTCKNWLHFQCAGLPEDWNEVDFFCGCSANPDIDKILQSTKAEDILTDSEIKDLEKKLQTGDILSNRMYMWKHKGFDLLLRKFYSDHDTIFNDVMTDILIMRLEDIFCVPGNETADQHMITEVILPEVVTQWLQKSMSLCRYQAEVVLQKTVRKDSGDKVKDKTPEKDSTVMRDSKTAAQWCQNENFLGQLTLPAVLDYDVQHTEEALHDLKNWDGETDENCPVEPFTFVFEKKRRP